MAVPFTDPSEVCHMSKRCYPMRGLNTQRLRYWQAILRQHNQCWKEPGKRVAANRHGDRPCPSVAPGPPLDQRS
jgi:hypothetical protein